MAEDFVIHGFEALKRKLEGLPLKIEKNIVRSMVRAGAQVVRKAAIAKLGGEKNAILILASRSKSKMGNIVFNVGINKDKWYLRYIEHGTYMSYIFQHKRTPKWKKKGRTPIGQIPRPFLRPALDENVGAVIEAMRKQGEKRIAKEAAKR